MFKPKLKPLTNSNQENPDKANTKKKKIYKILIGIGILLVMALIIFLIVKIVSSEPESDASVTDTFTDETKIYSKTNLVVSSGQVKLASMSRTVIYMSATSTGNLGGRSGADTLCVENKPSNLSAECTNIHAFLCVTSTDDISNMPDNYGYVTSSAVYWWHNGNQAYGRLATSWADMLDESIELNQSDGTGIAIRAWQGCNSYGIAVTGCIDWTSSVADDRGRYGTSLSTAGTWLWGGDTNCGDNTYYVRCVCEIL